MQYKVLFSILGHLLILNSIFLFIFFLIALFIYPLENQETVFLASFLASLIVGLIIRFFTGRSQIDKITYREGFAVASIGWMLVALIGALPFYFSGATSNFADAYFESMSGFTTTGATIMSKIEGKGYTILLWRCFTQWLGGIGIIVLTLAILPALGAKGGMQLSMGEGASPMTSKAMPTIAQSTRSLYITYLIFTLSQILLLFLNGMDLFEAICHAFSTISTGGFSPLDGSIGSYSNSQSHFHANYLSFEIIIFVFMFLSGCNFSLHYKLLNGNFRAYFQSIEFRYYSLITLSLVLLVSYDLYQAAVYSEISEIFRYSTFTVISILTGTGFATEDFDKWPGMSRNLILMIMFLGGMVGSTTGGVKIIRIAVMFKEASAEIRRAIHTRRIFTVRFGDDYLTKEATVTINAFMIIYLLVYFAGIFLLSFTDLDYGSIASMSIACLGNVGPGLSKIGPTYNYGFLPDHAKWILSLFMLLGRLELFPVMAMFLPKMWYK